MYQKAYFSLQPVMRIGSESVVPHRTVVLRKSTQHDSPEEEDLSNNQACQNHSKKIAQFIVDENKPLCSRCALNAAVLGKPIKELLGYDGTIKKQRLDQFLLTIEAIFRKVVFNLDQIKIRDHQIKQHYTQQVSQTKEIFDQIDKQLQSYRSQILKRLSEHMWQTLDFLGSQKNTLQNKLLEIERLKIDVQNNYEGIITRMEFVPFSNVMTKYEQKVQNIRIITENNNQFQIIQFNNTTTQNIDLSKVLSTIHLTTHMHDIYDKTFDNQNKYTPKQIGTSVSQLSTATNINKPNGNNNISSFSLSPKKKTTSNRKLEKENDSRKLDAKMFSEMFCRAPDRVVRHCSTLSSNLASETNSQYQYENRCKTSNDDSYNENSGKALHNSFVEN